MELALRQATVVSRDTRSYDMLEFTSCGCENTFAQ